MINLPIWQLFEYCAAPDTPWTPGMSGATPITLQPQDCWNLINLDPFAAGNGQSTALDPTREVNLGSIWNFGTLCSTSTQANGMINLSLPCTISGVQLTQSLQNSGTTITTGTTSYQSIVTSSESLAEMGTVAIGPLSLGGNVTETAMNSNSLLLTYQTSQSVLNQATLSSTVTLQDSNTAISTYLWLDEIFASYMFPDPTAPVVNLSQLAANAMTEDRQKKLLSEHPSLREVDLSARIPSEWQTIRVAVWPVGARPGRGSSVAGPWIAKRAGAELTGKFSGSFVIMEAREFGSEFSVTIDGHQYKTLVVPPLRTADAEAILKESVRAGNHTIVVRANKAGDELDLVAAAPH